MRNVHTLKGLSGNLSINVIYHTASQIVSLLRADDLEGAKALFPSLEEEYGAVSKAIGLAAEADQR
ncbi:MAG: Hpt domain-containing protein [Cloacibacillus sp.]|nr:Hpt domain-containing protein [Cloacibacillus sp.]